MGKKKISLQNMTDTETNINIRNISNLRDEISIASGSFIVAEWNEYFFS